MNYNDLMCLKINTDNDDGLKREYFNVRVFPSEKIIDIFIDSDNKSSDLTSYLYQITLRLINDYVEIFNLKEQKLLFLFKKTNLSKIDYWLDLKDNNVLHSSYEKIQDKLQRLLNLNAFT